MKETHDSVENFLFYVIIAVVFLVGLLAGLICSYDWKNNNWEKEVISRGFAHYTCDGTNKTAKFEWKE